MNEPEQKNTILRGLCSKYGIEESPQNGNIGRGWEAIIEECFRKAKEIGACCEYSQIKEKFGELRIYQKSTTPFQSAVEIEHTKIIDEACKKSSVTCIACGSPGTIRVVSGWWRQSFCSDCHEKAVKIWNSPDHWELIEEFLLNGVIVQRPKVE